MTPEERTLIEGLFRRLNETAKTLPSDQIDPEADRAIRGAVAAQPIAPYLLVQNALVMESAMQAAQARIAELEATQAQAAAPAPQRSFLSGASPWTRNSVAASPPPPPPAYGQPAYQQPGYAQPGYAQPGYPQPGPGFAQPGFGQQPGQPSFLRSALTTAAGVAGGALLFQGVSSLLSSHGGGGAFASAAQQTPTVVNETVNNYYGESAQGQGQGLSQGASQGQNASYDSPPVDDRNYTPASYDPPDTGGDWGGGSDDEA